MDGNIAFRNVKRSTQSYGTKHTHTRIQRQYARVGDWRRRKKNDNEIMKTFQNYFFWPISEFGHLEGYYCYCHWTAMARAMSYVSLSRAIGVYSFLCYIFGNVSKWQFAISFWASRIQCVVLFITCQIVAKDFGIITVWHKLTIVNLIHCTRIYTLPQCFNGSANCEDMQPINLHLHRWMMDISIWKLNFRGRKLIFIVQFPKQ